MDEPMADLRVVAKVLAATAAVVVVGGFAQTLEDGVSLGDGIAGMCLLGVLVLTAVGLVAAVRWFLRRSGPTMRALVAVAFVGLVVFASMWRVEYAHYNGCNWSADGNQPLIAVPVSLVTNRPFLDNGGLYTARGCPEPPNDDQVFEVGPFGDVPGR